MLPSDTTSGWYPHVFLGFADLLVFVTREPQVDDAHGAPLCARSRTGHSIPASAAHQPISAHPRRPLAPLATHSPRPAHPRARRRNRSRTPLDAAKTDPNRLASPHATTIPRPRSIPAPIHAEPCTTRPSRPALTTGCTEAATITSASARPPKPIASSRHGPFGPPSSTASSRLRLDKPSRGGLFLAPLP